MVLFHTFWVQTDFAFFAFEDGLSSILLTSTIFRFTFHNHMTQGVKFYSCPCYSRGVERLCSLVSAILSKGFKHKFLVISLNQLISNHFFSIGVFFHESQDCRGLLFWYHSHSLHRQLNISRASTAESSSLPLGSSWTRTGNL